MKSMKAQNLELCEVLQMTEIQTNHSLHNSACALWDSMSKAVQERVRAEKLSPFEMEYEELDTIRLCERLDQNKNALFAKSAFENVWWLFTEKEV